MELGLTPDTVQDFIEGIFSQLNDMLDRLEATESQEVAVLEAELYLRGAQALFSSAVEKKKEAQAYPKRPEAALVHMEAQFESAYAHMAQLRDRYSGSWSYLQ